MRAQVAGARRVTKVVITRSRKGNADLARMLEGRGFEPVSIETIEFLPPEDWSSVDAALRRLGGFDWLLFTSATAAEFFAKRMEALSLDVPWRGRPFVAAVGEKTGAALREEGVEVAFVPTEFLTEALARELPRDRGKAVLMLRADIGDRAAVAALERGGFRVLDLPIYRTSSVAGGGDEATGRNSFGDADAIVFASPSAVEAFMSSLDASQMPPGLTKKLVAVCIGPVTATAARARGFERVLTAKTHTVEGILQSLEAAATAGEGE